MRREMNTLAAAYVLDALPTEERSAFETYVGAAPDTAREVAELFATAAVLGATDRAAPPSGLRSRVLQQVTQTRQLAPLTGGRDGTAEQPPTGSEEMLLRRISREVRPMPVETGRQVALDGDVRTPDAVVPVDAVAQRHRRTIGTRVAAAFALAAVVALGIVVGVQADQLSGARSDTQAAQQKSAAIAAVVNEPDVVTKTTQVAGGGRATVLLSSTAHAGVVVLNGVAALPADKTYQLWLIDPTRKARSVGTFATAQEAAQVRFADVRAGDQLGLSIEPAGGSAAPTTKPVFALPIA